MCLCLHAHLVITAPSLLSSSSIICILHITNTMLLLLLTVIITIIVINMITTTITIIAVNHHHPSQQLSPAAGSSPSPPHLSWYLCFLCLAVALLSRVASSMCARWAAKAGPGMSLATSSSSRKHSLCTWEG